LATNTISGRDPHWLDYLQTSPLGAKSLTEIGKSRLLVDPIADKACFVDASAWQMGWGQDVVSEGKPTRQLKAFYAIALLLFAESFVGLFHPYQLPVAFIRALYPSWSILHGYCSAHPCLYDSSAVASVYVAQLLSLVGFALLLSPIMISPKWPMPRATVTLLAIVIIGSFVDYLKGNFSFAPTWIIPNSIAVSPLGLLRYAVLFSLAALSMVLLATGVPPDASRSIPSGRQPR